MTLPIPRPNLDLAANNHLSEDFSDNCSKVFVEIFVSDFSLLPLFRFSRHSQLPLEMQSKVTSYMKLDSSSETECCNAGNLTKGKYHILPTNDDEASLSTCHFPPGSVISSNGLGKDFLDLRRIIDLEIRPFFLNYADHNKNGEIRVSPVVVAKFLESELKSKNVKHCETCSCATKFHTEGFQTMFNAGTQTDMSLIHCLRCNSNLNSPSHTNSPYLMKLKSSDSVISETKSSVSDFTNHNDKTFTPSKKDDLMVNPILGHHRLCEHTKSYNYQPFLPEEEEEVIKGTEITVSKPPPDITRSVATTPNESKIVEEKTNQANQPTSLSHGAGNGSNNSLWSKTSSKDGAKLFESFNRNLIKVMRVSIVLNEQR